MEMTASTLIIQALHGLVYGMLLFLVASGMTLVFGMMDILNIAHAAFYMLGAYLGYTVLVTTGNFWLALIVAPVGVGFIGTLVERFFVRKAHGYGHAFELLITFGVFLVITEAVKWIWGDFPRPVDAPASLSGSVRFLGFQYPVYRFFILAISAVVMAALLYVFLKTRIGIRIRAAVSDAEMVDVLGVNVPRLFLSVFSDLENLMKTGAALGWKCVTGSYYLSDPFSAQIVKNAGIGSATADIYMITIDTPENKEFIRDWYAEHKTGPVVSHYPDLFSGRCYYSVRWLADVIKKAGGTEAEKIIPAWEGMEYNMPWGKVTMRKCDHQMITPGVAAVVQAKSEFYDFPFIGKPTFIPAEAITVPPAETGNPRCK
jgi:ABC-type uncharacterized transport system permease subunit